MTTISLTSFVDFVSKSGTPKLTAVKKTRKQMSEGYGPEKDFYKRFRESVIEMHRKSGSISTVTSILPGLTNSKKMKAYPRLVEGYRKWSGRKGAEWFEPVSAIWSSGGLTVRVNPELGLVVKGTPHLIKLYFKEAKLTKNRIDIITHLMAVACAAQAPNPCVMGVLDVRRSKLITPTVPIDGLGIMLDSEAAYWITAWNQLD